MSAVDSTPTLRREQLARRRARAQGLRLSKARPRFAGDWLAESFMLVDAATSAVVYAEHASGSGYGLDLADVESYLSLAG